MLFICENCGKEHDGSFGSGRFCSKSCANTRLHSEDTKEKISNTVKRLLLTTYTCEKCGKSFESTRKFKKGRKIHCENCILKYEHSKENPLSIMDLSKRTITKILKRSHSKCVICGWNESTCDIHHIIPKSKGGSDNIDNLIILCPNCHRVVHTTSKYDAEYLMLFSISNTFNNWKDYYYIKN